MSDLDFEAWLRHVFDHEPVLQGPAWYWDDPDSWWQATPAERVALLTRLFEQPNSALRQFGDNQIGEGLWYLIDSSVGDYCRSLTDGNIPIEDRIRCIQAMFNLFKLLFEPRCAPALCHLDEAPGNKLNVICYMWWDVIPLYGYHDGERSDPRPNPIDNACLAVMRETLGLRNPACQETALHGLGHWARAYPEVTAAAIDAYLAGNPTLRPELVRYAQAARSGCVQ